jgi:hypothetical protein
MIERVSGAVSAVERGLELLLEIVLAALDLVDDRGVVAAGHRGLEVKEALVGGAEEAAVVGALPPRRRISARSSSAMRLRSSALRRNSSWNLVPSAFWAASR